MAVGMNLLRKSFLIYYAENKITAIKTPKLKKTSKKKKKKNLVNNLVKTTHCYAFSDKKIMDIPLLAEEVTGYRLVEINYYTKEIISMIHQHSRICPNGQFVINGEDRKGHAIATKLIFKCNTCNREEYVVTEDPRRGAIPENEDCEVCDIKKVYKQ